MHDQLKASIRCQNRILTLANQHHSLAQTLCNTKDAMRKIREKELDTTHSVYCLVAGVPLKQSPQQLYSTLTKEASRVGRARDELRGELVVLMRGLLGQLRLGSINGWQVDMEVKRLLGEWQASIDCQ